jgi:hypothetical protein
MGGTTVNLEITERIRSVISSLSHFNVFSTGEADAPGKKPKK